MIKVIPNLLTSLRIFLIPVIVFAIQIQSWNMASAVFILAATTDFLDGFIARKFSVESKIGRMMDAIADKLLTLSIAWALLIVIGQLSLIFVIVITLRELLVTLLRLINSKFRDSSSSKVAKWKTFILYTLLAAVLFANTPILESSKLLKHYSIVLLFFEVTVIILSAFSFIDYLLAIKTKHNDGNK